MVFPDVTNLEANEGSFIDDLGTSMFVCFVALTASIAGSLFGYDTGIISAVLVYLGTDLGRKPASATDKELICQILLAMK